MKVKEVAMVIALAILGAAFVGLFVDAVYESPKYEDFCGTPTYRAEPYPKYIPPGQEVVCNYTAMQSEVETINQCYADKGQPEFNYDGRGCQTSYKECNYCNKYFEEANNRYNRNLFFINAPIGLVGMLVGLFLAYEVVGAGLMFSGIILLAYATIRYFSNMSKVMRVIVIFIELVMLIIVSIKKLKK